MFGTTRSRVCPPCLYPSVATKVSPRPECVSDTPDSRTPTPLLTHTLLAHIQDHTALLSQRAELWSPPGIHCLGSVSLLRPWYLDSGFQCIDLTLSSLG